jgi:hypothetical protein
VDLDPKRIDAYYHLGLSQYFLGDLPKAAGVRADTELFDGVSGLRF